MDDNYITPPDHSLFLAKKLFSAEGGIMDGAIAHIKPGGGGPRTPHTHTHNHLFIVVEGTATILLDGREITVSRDCALTVTGALPHSVWNKEDIPLVMVGISIRPLSTEVKPVNLP